MTSAALDSATPARRRVDVRRALDAFVAAAALVLLAPVFVLTAAAIRLTSRGPALFRQERVGRGEQPFTMYKFRTMRIGGDDTAHRAYVTRLITEDAPPCGGTAGIYKLSGDPRVTRVGAVLRRLSLDELPQLLNVVRGEMALVGPRPMLPFEAALLAPRYRARFGVRPGVTGLWQVSGRSRLTMREALELDLRYVTERGWGLDLRIIAKTLPAVLFSRLTS